MSQEKLQKYFSIKGKENKRRRSINSEEKTVNKISKTEDMATECGNMHSAWLNDIMSSINQLSQQMAMVATKEDLNNQITMVATKEDISNVDAKIERVLLNYGNVEQELADIRKENKELKNRIEELENRTRKNNLIFRGLPDNIDYELIIKDVCKDLFKVQEPINIVQAFQIGKLNNNKSIVLVEFASYRDVSAIMAKISNSKDSGISVKQDVGPLTRKRRGKLLLLRREIKRTCRETKIGLRTDCLTVSNQEGKNVKLKWCEQDGLVTGGGGDGIKALLDLTGYNFAKVWDKIENNSVGIKPVDQISEQELKESQA